MPRGFSDREKEMIRSELLRKGKALFEMYGPRKTNVEELTAAAGISKGAFYLFFGSKEELFFEVLQVAEAEVKQRLLSTIEQPGAAPRQRFRDMLASTVVLWKSNPLFAQVNKNEYEHLLRKLPPEKVQAHLQDDSVFAQKFVDHWQQAGVTIRVAPELVSELIRSLFFVSLHEKEFSAGMYTQVIDVLIDGIVQYVVQEAEVQHDRR